MFNNIILTKSIDFLQRNHKLNYYQHTPTHRQTNVNQKVREREREKGLWPNECYKLFIAYQINS